MEKTNTDLEKEFFKSINQGNVYQVREHVTVNRELLSAFDYGCFGATPLTSVTFKDDRPMITALIELGADVNRRSDWDMGPWSPLHSAIHSNKMDLVEFLLAQGAEMDVHTAAALGRLDVLTELLDANPSRVSEPGGDGCQPLHFAGTTEAADLLLARGADIDARCIDHHSTPVQYLAPDRSNIARHLFRRGATADIFSAVIAGDEEVVSRLVAEDQGVLDLKINQETFPPGPEHDVHTIMTFTVGHHSTGLHAAAIGNQPDMIRLLIVSGIDPNVRGGYDEATAMHQAAWQDNLDAANALVEAGADINLRSGEIHNNNAAGWAIVAGSADVFCMLMDRGADVLDFFKADANAAVEGKFRQYKVVPQENYERIHDRLAKRI